MAKVKISALPAVSAAALTDFFAVVQTGVTSKENLQQVLDLFETNIEIPQNQVTDLVADLNSKVNLAGDTMTGYLILNADPVAALGAATKQYVDSVVTTNTFTPIITGSVADPDSITYAAQVGRYVKIENLVNFHVTITLSAITIGGGSGNIQISGLPFTSANVSNQVPNFVTSYANLNLGASAVQVSGQIVINDTKLVLYESVDNGARAAIQLGALSNSSEIYVSGFYFV
jgi:hypothetical protein